MKKQHTTLTKERWAEFPRYKQFLMIGTEFERASNNLANKEYDYYISALSRAHELINLTAVCNSSNYNFTNEILRLRDLIAKEIINVDKMPNLTNEVFLYYQKALYNFDQVAYNLMYKSLHK